MFYESLIILNISTLNFSEGMLASVLVSINLYTKQIGEQMILSIFMNKE